MEEPVISTSDLRREFEDVTALDNINLTVEHGVFGFIGPNGAGKTTLIRILVGLIRPTAGKAQVLGLDVQRDSLKIRKRIGVLHEKPSFPKHMSCLGYLQRVAKLYDVDPSSAKELCDSVGLHEARERQIGKLSAGMLQRIGIAQAFAGKPELLILDEPTSNLDVVGRGEILNLILKMHRETGVSFFVSSHVLSELEKVCNNVAFILSGRIIEKGEMPSVIEKYTKGRYRLTVSDPARLLADLKNIDYVTIEDTSDSTGIVLILDPKRLDTVRKKIYDAAESLGIVVRSFGPADSLEDAFREAIKIENKE